MATSIKNRRPRRPQDAAGRQPAPDDARRSGRRRSSAIVAGAPAPIVAVALLQRFGSSVPISGYLGLAAVLTLVAVYAARETQGRDLAERIHAQ